MTKQQCSPSDATGKTKNERCQFRKTGRHCVNESLTWLCCAVDKENPSVVDMLTCAMCTIFEDNLCGLKNFSSAWITGSSNY